MAFGLGKNLGIGQISKASPYLKGVRYSSLKTITNELAIKSNTETNSDAEIRGYDLSLFIARVDICDWHTS